MSGGVWDVARLQTATEAAGIGLWSWNIDTDRIAMDRPAHAIWGVSDGKATTFEELSSRIHPADLDKVRRAFAAAREAHGPYENDFRIRLGEQIRWVSARGRSDERGVADRVMYGVFLDITVRKLAEDLRELANGEMHHRIKNLFAVAQALAFVSSRSTATKEDMSRDLEKRLQALSVAHDLIRPKFNDQTRAAPLGDLLSVLLTPYAENNRVTISAPPKLVGEKSATSLALVVHELATNSIKYGALSVSSGRLDIRGEAQDSELSILWRESGGPPVPPLVETPGFGTKLMMANVRDQLGGAISSDWRKEGLVVTLRVNAARLEE